MFSPFPLRQPRTALTPVLRTAHLVRDHPSPQEGNPPCFPYHFVTLGRRAEPKRGGRRLVRIKRGETLGYPPCLRVRKPGIVRCTRNGQTLRLEVRRCSRSSSGACVNVWPHYGGPRKLPANCPRRRGDSAKGIGFFACASYLRSPVGRLHPIVRQIAWPRIVVPAP
jgi:hypothetical protein